ncbi:MAG: pantoate--beta-alanine ligase [Gammaproteobacteria bacterium]|nr:pantoate--beta-alanine ligase [Gammaproteobacteria bacterium]
MQLFETRDDLQSHLAQIRRDGKKIGLVPTMGNLHQGHLALVDAAKQECDFVLSSIFVNPLQFGPNEDFENYPKSPDSDYEKLEQQGCDGVFEPAVSEMYPGDLDSQTLVTVLGLSERHCGVSRPMHFGGVCTIVSKLFNLTMPDLAFFGEKDFQQLQIIKKMVRDLCIPIKVIGIPTERMDNGLALSSRNFYLDNNQLEIASSLYKCLQNAAEKIETGNNNFFELEDEAALVLEDAGLRPEYFHICHAGTLEPASPSDQQLVILSAVWLGRTRLIDNIQIDLNG